MIENFDTGEMLMYMPDKGQAMKMSLDTSGAETQTQEDPSQNVENIMQWEPNVKGQEEINGKSCVIVEYTDSSGMTTTMWIWEDHGFPVKTVTETQAGEVVTEFTELDFECPSESKFELPEGVEVMDLGDMGGFDSGSTGIPDMP